MTIIDVSYKEVDAAVTSKTVIVSGENAIVGVKGGSACDFSPLSFLGHG